MRRETEESGISGQVGNNGTTARFDRTGAVSDLTSPDAEAQRLWASVPVDRFVDVYGHQVRYWMSGEGKPVLFVHGLGASVEFWQANVVGLADCLRTIAVDLPGFGRSERGTATYTLQGGAAFLRDLLDALTIRRVSLVGNSLGGALCLQFALDFPERIDRLVLVASAGLGRELTWALRLLALPGVANYFLRKATPQSVVQGIMASMANPNNLPPEVLRACVDVCSHPRALAAFAEVARTGIGLMGQRGQNILRHRLAEIQAPTLIMWGQQDTVIPVSHAYVAKQHIANAELVILDNCGHCPQLDHPERVNELLRQFLA